MKKDFLILMLCGLISLHMQATDGAYTIQSKQNGYYMTLSAEGITIAEEPCELMFEEAGNDKYYITDGEYYVGLAGTDRWSMTSNPDKKEALTVSRTIIDGQIYYKLEESLGMIGVDYPYKNNFGCWADKTGGDAVLWSIVGVGNNTEPFVPARNIVELDGIYYCFNVTDNVAEVTYLTKTYSGNLEIPASVQFEEKTYSVTSIGVGACAERKGLTSVTIPESIMSIGKEAFYGCGGLTSINIPNSVTSIGKEAFRYCEGLSSIDIPNSVTSIGAGAFYGCI